MLQSAERLQCLGPILQWRDSAQILKDLPDLFQPIHLNSKILFYSGHLLSPSPGSLEACSTSRTQWEYKSHATKIGTEDVGMGSVTIDKNDLNSRRAWKCKGGCATV